MLIYVLFVSDKGQFLEWQFDPEKIPTGGMYYEVYISHITSVLLKVGYSKCLQFAGSPGEQKFCTSTKNFCNSNW